MVQDTDTPMFGDPPREKIKSFTTDKTVVGTHPSSHLLRPFLPTTTQVLQHHIRSELDVHRTRSPPSQTLTSIYPIGVFLSLVPLVSL